MSGHSRQAVRSPCPPKGLGSPAWPRCPWSGLTDVPDSGGAAQRGSGEPSEQLYQKNALAIASQCLRARGSGFSLDAHGFSQTQDPPAPPPSPQRGARSTPHRVAGAFREDTLGSVHGGWFLRNHLLECITFVSRSRCVSSRPEAIDSRLTPRGPDCHQACVTYPVHTKGNILG